VKEIGMSLEELEKRIQAIEDMEAIKKLHQNYINLMDNMEYTKVLDLFTDDCTSEVRNSGIKRGKKEIEDIYLIMLAKRRAGQRNEGHFAVEPDITVDGNVARGAWLIYMLFSKPTVQWVQGKNECEYMKVNGQWKIHKLKFTRTLASDPSMYP
jgi:ketosteroid isomerase-like protein